MGIISNCHSIYCFPKAGWTSGYGLLHLKPIFHWILGLCWPPNANEINTKNIKCTWPTRKLWFGTQHNLYSTDLRWGFALGVSQILKFALVVTQILAFLDTNRMVSPKQNCGIGGLGPNANGFASQQNIGFS